MFKLALLFGPFAIAALIRALWGLHWQALVTALAILPLASVAVVAVWLDPRIPSDLLLNLAYLGMALITAGVGLIAGNLLNGAGRQ